MDALDKNKNKEHVDKTKKEDWKVRYLRTFLSKEKTRALHNKDAQMYFAWMLAAEKGMVIEPDRDDGFRQVTFGDLWRHLQSIGFDISPELEKALREREGADRRRASGRSYRRTLGDLGDL